MESFIKMIEIQGVLLLYLLIGAFCRKTGIITKEARISYTSLVVNILLPSLVLNSFNQDLSLEQLKTAGLILSISLIICIVSYLLGKILYNRYPHQIRSILQYGTLISNSGFAGLPLIAMAYGELGLFYASIFIIPNRIFMWSAGISFFTNADFKTSMKTVLLNPGIIAVGLGLIKMLFHIPIPEVLGITLRNVGNTTMPLAMILIGTVLAEIDIRSIFITSVMYLSFIRLILLPGVTLVVLKLLNVDPLILAVSVLLTAMPVGSTAAILAEKYGSDYEFGSKCVFHSTVLSLITVPILTLFL